MPDFLHATLGRTGLEVHRLGLSATMRPGKQAVHQALDAGVNYFFGFGIDTQMFKALRDLPPSDRQRIVIASGAGTFLLFYQNLRKSLERRLRQLRTDYMDVFMFMGVLKEKHFPEKAREELQRLKEDGKVRFTGMSTHDRPFAGRMADQGALDVIMMRYNAAHRGAEQDVFPHLAAHNPGVVNFTATRWRYLMKRQKSWPKDRPIPTPGQCYRFVLSSPHVHVCLNAPMNVKQLQENIAALEQGPLTAEEMSLMCEYGELVYQKTKKMPLG
jgi:aryl-alcohol dehydrogenase-like predicted oxidoreductase